MALAPSPLSLTGQYKAGDYMAVLAKRWGLHRTTVTEHLRRRGVKRRGAGVSPGALAEVVRLYVNAWSLQRLAERYACDAETVR